MSWLQRLFTVSSRPSLYRCIILHSHHLWSLLQPLTMIMAILSHHNFHANSLQPHRNQFASDQQAFLSGLRTITHLHKCWPAENCSYVLKSHKPSMFFFPATLPRSSLPCDEPLKTLKGPAKPWHCSSMAVSMFQLSTRSSQQFQTTRLQCL